MKAICFHPRNALSIAALLALLLPSAAFGQEISAEQDALILEKMENHRELCGLYGEYALAVQESLAEGLEPEALMEQRAAELDESFAEDIGRFGLQEAKEIRKETLDTVAAALAGFGRGAVGKTAVAGVRERGGKVVAKPVKQADAKTLIGFVDGHVAPGATIHTDEAKAYQALPNIFNQFRHETVNHGEGEFVRGAGAPPTPTALKAYGRC